MWPNLHLYWADLTKFDCFQPFLILLCMKDTSAIFRLIYESFCIIENMIIFWEEKNMLKQLDIPKCRQRSKHERNSFLLKIFRNCSPWVFKGQTIKYKECFLDLKYHPGARHKPLKFLLRRWPRGILSEPWPCIKLKKKN